MKPLNLLTVFTRPSIFAAAMSIAVVVAFVSSASADENKFDALGGVTAEALTPAAMDNIQGTGSVHRHFVGIARVGKFHIDEFTKSIGAAFDITINLWRGAPNFRVKVTREDSD